MKLHQLLVCMCVVMTGCTIGNGMICGPQTPAAYCDKEAYEALMHPKPYIEKWDKINSSSEIRGRDSKLCSAHTTSDWAWTDEDVNIWDRCMLKKGYRFTGNCFDPVMKEKPACGAP